MFIAGLISSAMNTIKKCAIYSLMLTLPLLLIWATFFNANSTKETSVRIVSWWSYLESESKRSELENLCNTKIELTEFYDIHSYEENLQIAEYDIYIYPGSFFKRFPEHLPLTDGPNLTDLTHSYYGAIKKRYDQAELPKNTLFFQDGVNVFVYDKDLLPSIETLTAVDILQLYEKGAVVLADEPLQLDYLFRQEGTDPDRLWSTLHNNFQTDSFNRQTYLKEPSRIVFSSAGTSTMREDLVLGYMDSGELINPNLRWDTLKNPDGGQKNIAFGIHPKFSPITTDLLTVRGGNPAAECLAREMGSQPFLNWITQTNFYFSPYGDIPHTGKAGEEIGREYLANVDSLAWYGANLGEITYPSAQAMEMDISMSKAQDHRAAANENTTTKTIPDYNYIIMPNYVGEPNYPPE